MKTFIFFVVSIISSNTNAECFARSLKDGNIELRGEHEYAYIVEAFGEGYINHYQNKLLDFEEKNSEKPIPSIIDLNPDKLFSLPVSQTLQGPEKDNIVITQTHGDAPGIKDGNSYTIIINTLYGHDKVDTCNIFRVE